MVDPRSSRGAPRRLTALWASALAVLFALPACQNADKPESSTDSSKQAAPKKSDMKVANPLPVTSEVTKGDIGSIKVQTTKNGFWFTGQPSESDFGAAAARGMKTVINFRTDGEIDWDEGPVVQKLGMRYVHLPFRSPSELTDEFFAKARAAIQKAEKPAMLQCGSSNRVGAIWFTYLTLDEGVDAEAAMAEAKAVGLRSEALAKRAQEYVDSQR